MILVHHLRIGRPLFTVWLLEELGLDYKLKIYERDPKTMRAGPELREAHPLGKSPVIEDDGLVLAETGAIAAYLIDNYDSEGAFAPPRDRRVARARYEQWMHYPEGSAFTPLLMTMLLARSEEPVPKLISRFAEGETALHLGYIESELGDKSFILGDRLQGPDIGLSYIVSMARRLGLIEDRARLRAYLDRVQARPAFARALARAGA